MARADIVTKVKSTLYGTGIYERPVLIQLNPSGNTNISPTDGLVTFQSVAADQNKVKPGAVLSATNGDPTEDWCFYVTAISGTAVTATATYLGSTAPSSSNLNGILLEQSPKVTEAEIHRTVDTVVNAYLWPELFKWVEATIASPTLETMQDELPADMERMFSASQKVGNRWLPVRSRVSKHQHATISSTGVLGEFGYQDASPMYYTYISKLTEADTSDVEFPWLEDLIVMGAAAILMDSSVPNLTVPYRPNVMDTAVQTSAAEAIWRNFLQIREYARLDLSRDSEYFEVVH